MNLAGVDYQLSLKPYLVGAEKMVARRAFNVLLSHNPDVFPVAAQQGYQLTIAGHTHGGQIESRFCAQDLNIARFLRLYVEGLYRQGESSISSREASEPSACPRGWEPRRKWRY